MSKEGHPPEGFHLVHTLKGHGNIINRIAWSRDGSRLASASQDTTVRIWDGETGHELRTLIEHHGWVWCAVWSPDGKVASGSDDQEILVWNPATGQVLQRLHGHAGAIYTVAWLDGGRTLASGGHDSSIHLWDIESGQEIYKLDGHSGGVNSLFWIPDLQILVSGSNDGTIGLWDLSERSALRKPPLTFLKGHAGSVSSVSCAWTDKQVLASGSEDGTIRIWDVASAKPITVLEGHTGGVSRVFFSFDGRLLASKSKDGSVRLWKCPAYEPIVILPESASASPWHAGIAFHPSKAVLATLGFGDTVIRIWRLRYDELFGAPQEQTVRYRNARVVLVGDTGVGKTGLATVLTGHPFQPTTSSEGRHVWTLESSEHSSPNGILETRETLLWDLAGQPGYRLIHQLHLHEVSVALVVCDARSETDPLAGARYWDRALRQATQRARNSPVPMKKFLVAARMDRGGISVSKQRIQAEIEKMGFDGFFETSAEKGWQISDLREAISRSIEWEALPLVKSPKAFHTIKEFLLEEKLAGHLLSPASDLFAAFCKAYPVISEASRDLAATFHSCITRLENRDLIRVLSFGGYVLVQPELLDSYASAIVNAAREEPDGLGCIAETGALLGRFRVDPDVRVTDAAMESLLLLAMVEELIEHDLALRENADDGQYLVFPSQFNRDWEEAPDPEDTTVTYVFEGALQNIYTTLVVRLAHSGRFETGRTQMWRNAVVYAASYGGRCGVYLRERSEARGELTVFYRDDEQKRSPTQETRFHFERYIEAHLRRRAVINTFGERRAFVCRNCNTVVPRVYADGRRNRKLDWIECAVCGLHVSLIDETPVLRKAYPSHVSRMEQAADRERDYDMAITSATAELQTEKFARFLGAGSDAMAAIVITDILGSTEMMLNLGAEAMDRLRTVHFDQTRRLLRKFGGQEVKTLGDGFLSAFRTCIQALDFALGLYSDTGDARVAIRAGIHTGPIQIREDDVFGPTVNFAARVASMAIGAEIWGSNRAKQDIEEYKAERHSHVQWVAHYACKPKGFPECTLWSVLVPQPTA
jgi:WD40 repeat protein/class 3 adenylate cyclase